MYMYKSDISLPCANINSIPYHIIPYHTGTSSARARATSSHPTPTAHYSTTDGHPPSTTITMAAKKDMRRDD